MSRTLKVARKKIKAVGSEAVFRDVVADLVADKGFYSNETVLEFQDLGLLSYLSETDQVRRSSKRNNKHYDAPEYLNRRPMRARRYQRQGSESVERPFAHQFVPGRVRRILFHCHINVCKRLLVHLCGFNLGSMMCHLTRVDTLRSLQVRAWMRLFSGFRARLGGGSIGTAFRSVPRRRPDQIRCFRLQEPIIRPYYVRHSTRTIIFEIGPFDESCHDTFHRNVYRAFSDPVALCSVLASVLKVTGCQSHIILEHLLSV